MSNEPKRSALSVALTTCTAIISAYFIGYLMLCDVSGYSAALRYQTRRYDPDWLGKSFIPAAWLEAKLLRRTVHVQRSNAYGYFEHDYIAEP